MFVNKIHASLPKEMLDEIKLNSLILGAGGSYAYGTNVEGSDLDLRGAVYLPAKNILLGKDFGTWEDKERDIVLHSVNKFFKLAAAGNPNVLELFGLRDEDYLVGQKFAKDNASLFLSKRCIVPFEGFRKNEYKRARNGDKKAAMNSIRLLLMGIDILEQCKVVTYREKERDLLIQIRTNGISCSDFDDAVADLEKRFDYAFNNSSLPENPNYEAIDALLMDINKSTVVNS